MNFTVRIIGSLIKFLIYVCIILIAVCSVLFWFDTGSWLVLPIARRAGNFFLAPLEIHIDNINGSLRSGYSLKGLKIISGDENLFTLDYASVSPDWDYVLDGMDGLPFVKSLNVKGISTDLDKTLALVAHFSSPKDDTPEEISDVEHNDTAVTISSIRPVNVNIHDINFATPYANVKLDALTLNDAGKLTLDTKIISHDNIFPIKTFAQLNFSPIQIISSDLFLGTKGTGNFAGTLEPLTARLSLTALSLEELLNFAPPMDINATGRLDGRFYVDENLNTSGVISMPRANVMDIPLNFRLPFRWNGKNCFALDNATLNTKAASVKLDASADIYSMRIIAMGEALNISLNEIGKLAAPNVGLAGEGGNVKFDVDTILSGDILSRTRADVIADIPSISAAGMRILKGLNSHIKLVPNETPKISAAGEIFGGKLFARGEAMTDNDGNIKPQAIVSVVNLDLNTLIKTFPDVAKSVTKPSGKITATAKVSDNLDVTGKITSDKLSANGVTLTNLLANIFYDTSHNRAALENFSARLGKGLITASGNANLNDNTFKFTAGTENFEPRAIPDLKQVSGVYNLKAEASGKFTNLDTIKANVNLNARNVGYSGMTLGNLEVPVTFANNTLNIANARASLPGGSLTLKGSVNLRNASNPALDLSTSTNGLNLAEVFRAFNLENKSMPVTGKLRGSVNVKGPLNTAAVNVKLNAENIKAGDLVNMPSAIIEAQGSMKRVDLRKLEAKINGAVINGSGNVTLNQRNYMNSALNFRADVKDLDLRQILMSSIGSAPVTGNLRSRVDLRGTIAKPELDVKLHTPVYASGMEINDIALRLRSPELNHYAINTSARIENFRPEADIDLRQSGNIWTYKLTTKPLDLRSALETRAPEISGMVKGFARIKVDGNTRANSPINLNVTADEIRIIDKVQIRNISIPVVYSPAKNLVTMKKGSAILSDGVINSGLEVDLNKSSWKGNVKVLHLDFGKLANEFLPEGELIGSIDVEVAAKGGFGVMPTSFANGKFTTTPGYFHKMALIDRVTPTKRISFEKISGTFFWNGNDLFLNPGTQATAGPDEPLYRYVSVNGSAGIPGKGLRLLFDGRFDLKILDQLLGAMKGVFQYMTGGLARNVLRDAAGRVLGVKSRDFQNISFTLANSWQELQLLDLKITKSIEDFLPIDMLNKDVEDQKDDTTFKMRIRIPTGPGDTSIEDESPEDQFKQQLIDNLFNIGL